MAMDQSLFLPQEFFDKLKEDFKELSSEEINKASLEELKTMAELAGDQYKQEQEALKLQKDKEKKEEKVYSKLEQMAEAYVLQNKPTLVKMNILAIKYWNKFVVKNKFFQNAIDLLKKSIASAGSWLWDALKGLLFLALFDPKGTLMTSLINMITRVVVWMIDLLSRLFPRILDAIFIALPNILMALYRAFLVVSEKIGQVFFDIISKFLERLEISSPLKNIGENAKLATGSLLVMSGILYKMGMLVPILKSLQTALIFTGKGILSLASFLWTALAPFLPIILAVIVAIGALIAIFIYAEKIVKFFEDMWKAFFDWFDQLGIFGKIVIGGLIIAVGLLIWPLTLAITLIYGLAKAFKFLKEVDWAKIWSGMMAMIPVIWNEYVVKFFMKSLPKWLNWALEGLIGMWDDMTSWIERKLRSIGKSISNLFTKEGFQAIMTKILDSIFGTNFTTHMYNGLMKAFVQITDFIQGFVYFMLGQLAKLPGGKSILGLGGYENLSWEQAGQVAKISRVSGLEGTQAAAIVKSAELAKQKNISIAETQSILQESGISKKDIADAYEKALQEDGRPDQQLQILRGILHKLDLPKTSIKANNGGS